MQFATLKIIDNIAVIFLDKENSSTNTISPDMLEGFQDLFNTVKEDSDIKGVVLKSSKKDFIVGADIEWFQNIESKETVRNLATQGHNLLNEIENFPKPVVAAIDGACMGGGLEIAMACHARVITRYNTILSLPEVRLGLLPGLGGTQRLPRLIGLQKSLDMLLTGKNIYPPQAIKYGLADKIVEQNNLLQSSIYLCKEIAAGTFKKNKIKKSILNRLLDNTGVGRNIVFKKAGEMVYRQTLGNYPAPAKIIESVKTGLNKGMKAGIESEINNFSELVLTEESKQLVNLFLGMNKLKKNPLKDQAKELKNIWIAGAGLMGGGIAEISIPKEYRVTVKDIKEESLQKLKKDIWKKYEKGKAQKKFPPSIAEKEFNRLTTSIDFSGAEHADIVIEAVFEDLKIKQQLLSEFESKTPEHCIFASNTSALPIKDIAAHSKRKSQVIGMHYFSPVPKMPLLEIVVTEDTAEWVTASVLELGVRQSKVCIVVKDGPGFYTTRILAPYFNEALLLLEEGAGIPEVDKALRQFGFPVGPITLLDEVGLDVGAHVMGGALIEHYKLRPGAKPSALVKKLYDAGFHGRKNKKGFFQYDEKTGKKVRGKAYPGIYDIIGTSGDVTVSPEIIAERLSMVMVKEALMCLEEKVIEKPLDGDIGAVFGLGFPPFRGGPFRYLDILGNEAAVKKLESLSDTYGERFSVPDILKEQALKQKKWYD
ncbi:MAG: fatty acid oxidation complex subunit alpha FadJ [Chitinophagaceae bacterium]|nr:MAG: fatty acid oxidation complex subunit alpha FadJ [Chitinophagaceae bacterium]